MQRKRFIIIAIITFLVNYLIDFFSKVYAVANIKGNPPVYYLHDTIMIYYAENSGAFLSMGSEWPLFIKYILLVIIPILVCLYGIYYCFFKEENLTRLVLIMSIVAGGLGNLIDRLFNDFKVVDFLNFGIGSLRTGILNVADMSVTFGVLILVFHEIRYGKKKAADSNQQITE
ncbi:MAG: signal peptidase II [Bacteroidales bacterium]